MNLEVAGEQLDNTGQFGQAEDAFARQVADVLAPRFEIERRDLQARRRQQQLHQWNLASEYGDRGEDQLQRLWMQNRFLLRHTKPQQYPVMCSAHLWIGRCRSAGFSPGAHLRYL